MCTCGINPLTVLLFSHICLTKLLALADDCAREELWRHVARQEHVCSGRESLTRPNIFPAAFHKRASSQQILYRTRKGPKATFLLSKPTVYKSTNICTNHQTTEIYSSIEAIVQNGCKLRSHHVFSCSKLFFMKKSLIKVFNQKPYNPFEHDVTC